MFRVYFVGVFSGDVEQVEGAEKITIKIFKNITLVHEAGMVVLEVRDANSVKLCQTFLKSVRELSDI